MKKNTWMTWLLALMWLPIASVANAGWSVVTDATPTQTTGVKGETTAYSWGETYKLTDNAKDYTIVKVTKAGESVAVTVPAETPVEMLVVGGGGAGGGGTANRGGGGGAGGLMWKSITFDEETELTLTVGAGGIASKTTVGNNGGDSTIADKNEVILTAFGGGGGGKGNQSNADYAGRDGGSGGGGGGVASGVGYPSAVAGNSSQTDGYGNAGGAGSTAHAGGGGGAGSSGGAGGSSTGTNGGGDGLAYAITGETVVYAAGGGGAAGGKGGSDGVGGSGFGGLVANSAPTAGAENTGSGGGGAGNSVPGDGADGIIVLRYIPPVDTRTPVDKPEISGAKFAYDGEDHKPVITPEEGWTVSYSAAEWVNIGSYMVTITLVKGYKWSDNTAGSLVIDYSVYDPNAVAPVEGEPTTTLGVVYGPSRVTTDWGYRYTLVDRMTADAFTVVVVTNARQNVTWNIPALATVETLVVGGGGAGGEVNDARPRGGGGGAGGLVWGKYFYPTAKTVTLRVGSGGAVAGESGGNSTIEIAGEALVTAHGGGGGGGATAPKSGGSGGGGAPPSFVTGAAAGEYLGELANAGGNAASTAVDARAGGGGGAGGVGGTGDASYAGAGGAGLAYAITGEWKGYAAGGGASPGGTGGMAEGVVIGGAGCNISTPADLERWLVAKHAVANTGSGGGGGGPGDNQVAGTGASGVIVLRYANVNQKFKLEENAQGELEAIPVAGLTFYLFR